MAYDAKIAERIRSALGGRTVREVKMFGGLSFMVDEQLAVSASGGGGMLVRADPDRVDELLEGTGATWAEMRGRKMKRGWLHIEPADLDDHAVSYWVDVALDHADADIDVDVDADADADVAADTDGGA